MVTGYTSFGSNADRQHAAYSQPAGSLQSRLLGSSKRVLKHEKRAHAPGNAGTQRIRATGQNASPIFGKAHFTLQQKRRSVMSAAFSTQLDVAGPTELQLSRLCSRLMGLSKWEKIYPCSNTDWLTNLEKNILLATELCDLSARANSKMSRAKWAKQTCQGPNVDEW